MNELELLKQRLTELRAIPNPELKILATIHSIEQMIRQREKTR